MTEAGQQSLSKAALRRIKEKEQRYQTILRAAEKNFAEKGFNRTSIEDIADAAEVAVGTVYFYFKNKEDLLIQLLNQIGFLLRKILGQEFKKGPGTFEHFLDAGRIFFNRICRDYPEKVIILMREAVGQGPKVEEQRGKIFESLIADLKEALLKIKDNQGFEYKNEQVPEVAATIIFGLFEKVAYHFLVNKDSGKEMEVIGQDVLDFMLGGLNNLLA